MPTDPPPAPARGVAALAAIRQRAEAANGGPWVYGGGAVYGAMDLQPDEPYLIAHVVDDVDAVFIAHARADIPALVELVDAQAARLAVYERLHAAAERWDTVCANDEQAWAEADHELGLAIDALCPPDRPRPQRCRCQFCLAKEQAAIGAAGERGGG